LLWDKWRTKRLLNKVPAPKGVPLIERLAILIASPDCQALREELYARLGHFHLLRYRFFTLANEFATPKSVANRLDGHEKKIAWQLRRLYRARNLIVHTSRVPAYVSTLIENGHDYLDSVMFEVIKSSCGDCQTVTIAQVFELTAVAYRKKRADIATSADFGDNRALILVS